MKSVTKYTGIITGLYFSSGILFMVSGVASSIEGIYYPIYTFVFVIGFVGGSWLLIMGLILLQFLLMWAFL